MSDELRFPFPVPDFDRLGIGGIHALPYGLLRLDAEGRILDINRREAHRSGKEPSEFIGRNFFTDVAPCTETAEFADVFRAGVRRGELSHTLAFQFPDGRGGWQKVTILLLSTEPGEGYVLVALGPLH